MEIPDGEAVSHAFAGGVAQGQATSYKVGMIKILALRDQARQAMGDRFNIRDFHEVVLSAGAVPLGVLQERVEAWAAA